MFNHRALLILLVAATLGQDPWVVEETALDAQLPSPPVTVEPNTPAGLWWLPLAVTLVLVFALATGLLVGFSSSVAEGFSSPPPPADRRHLVRVLEEQSSLAGEEGEPQVYSVDTDDLRQLEGGATQQHLQLVRWRGNTARCSPRT